MTALAISSAVAFHRFIIRIRAVHSSRIRKKGTLHDTLHPHSSVDWDLSSGVGAETAAYCLPFPLLPTSTMQLPPAPPSTLHLLYGLRTDHVPLPYPESSDAMPFPPLQAFLGAMVVQRVNCVVQAPSISYCAQASPYHIPYSEPWPVHDIVPTLHHGVCCTMHQTIQKPRRSPALLRSAPYPSP